MTERGLAVKRKKKVVMSVGRWPPKRFYSERRGKMKTKRDTLLSASGVLDSDGTDGGNNEGGVVRLDVLVDELHLVATEENGPDDGDLEVGELLTNAGVATGREGDVGVGLLLVLSALSREAIGIELIRVGVELVETHGESGGDTDEGSLGDGVVLVGHIDLGLADDHDDRRANTKRLLDDIVEVAHLLVLVVVQVEGLVEGQERLLFLHDLLHHILVHEHVASSPSRSNIRSVLTSKQQSNAHTGNVIIGDDSSIGILRVHQGMNHILSDLSSLTTLVDNILVEVSNQNTSLITTRVQRDGQVGVVERDGSQSAIQIIVELGELTSETRANLLSLQSTSRRQDSQSIKLIKQIMLTRLTPVLIAVLLNLLLDLINIQSKTLHSQTSRDELTLMTESSVISIVDDTSTEHRNSEVVSLASAKDLLGGLVESLLSLRTSHEVEISSSNTATENFSALQEQKKKRFQKANFE